MNLTTVVDDPALTLFMCVQVVGVSWLNDQALAVVSEQGPRSHVHLYDASGVPLPTAAPPFNLALGISAWPRPLLLILALHESEVKPLSCKAVHWNEFGRIH